MWSLVVREQSSRAGLPQWRFSLSGGSTMTHRLHPLSPAINAGNNTGVPATDQRGYKRIALGRVDIGSYEYLSFPMYCDSEFSRVGDDSEPISRDNSKPIERIVSDDGLVKVGFATIRATGNWNVSSTKSAVVSQEFPKLKIGISGELNSRLADHLFKGDVSNLFE